MDAKAVVDGLVSSCVVCGKHPVRFDYRVSDKLWDEVVPKELSPNVICLECFEEMGDGIPEDEWRVIYYTGKAGTVAFTQCYRSSYGRAQSKGDKMRSDTEIASEIKKLEELCELHAGDPEYQKLAAYAGRLRTELRQRGIVSAEEWLDTKATPPP